MVLPLWAVLAASLSFGADTPSGCPYAVTYKKVGVMDVEVPRRPLPPEECAFVASLEEPFQRLLRAMAAAKLKTDGIALQKTLQDEDKVNAAYREGTGVFLTRGFASCLMSDRAAAVGILCHELGHAVQWRGPDESAKLKVNQLYKGSSTDWKDLRNVGASVDLETQADSIGRVLCTNAGLTQEFEAMSKAITRCNGSQMLHQPDEHPAENARLKAALADKPGLAQERQRQIGQAIQRRARRLMAGLPNEEDQRGPDLSLSPRDWALTRAADFDRAPKDITIPQTYAALEARRLKSPDRLQPPPEPTRITVNAKAREPWPCYPAPKGEPTWADYADCYPMVGLAKTFDWFRSWGKR